LSNNFFSKIAEHIFESKILHNSKTNYITPAPPARSTRLPAVRYSYAKASTGRPAFRQASYGHLVDVPTVEVLL